MSGLREFRNLVGRRFVSVLSNVPQNTDVFSVISIYFLVAARVQSRENNLNRVSIERLKVRGASCCGEMLLPESYRLEPVYGETGIAISSATTTETTCSWPLSRRDVWVTSSRKPPIEVRGA